MKKIIVIFISALVVTLTGCVTTQTKLGGVESSVTGSAGSEANTAKNETATLTKCSAPLGVAALIEPNTSNTVYGAFLSQHKLPSPIPMIRLMMSQSNCFQVVDRGAASKAMEFERSLAKKGELQDPDKMQSGQMVGADWVITPNIISQDQNAGGFAGGVGAFLPGLLGVVAGSVSVKKLEAQTMLSLTSVRTGLQVAIAEGSATKSDVGFGGFGMGAGGLMGGGGFQSTEIGKIVMAAFLDAHNKLVEQIKSQQEVKGLIAH